MQGIYIALGLAALYVVLLFWLAASGRMARWNLSLMLGVVLMVRTQKGKRLIDAIARPRRFWNLYADIGTAIMLLGMVLLTAFFLWSVWFVLQPGSGVEPLAANEILVIPGVNPLVPLWYGIIGLIITLVVHEGGHGVLARANDIRVKSLGLLVAVIPIGAFVEPEELDLKVSARRARMRVFSAGVVVNLTVCLLSLVAFSALVGAAQPTPGLHVVAPAAGSPAEAAGIAPLDTLTALDGQPLTDTNYESAIHNLTVGQPFSVTTAAGLTRTGTVGNRWAAYSDSWQANITAGTPAGVAECHRILGPGGPTGAACAERFLHLAYLGITVLRPGDIAYLAHPFTSGGRGAAGLLSLPVGEVRGVPILSSYLPAFHTPPMSPEVYWPLVTVLFWVFWLNLMVGLTNILPMVPLDGGHLFKDAAAAVVERLRPGLDPDRRDRVVGRTAGAVSIAILVAFVLQIAGPHLVRAFIP